MLAVTDRTNADHVIITLKSRYTWFANHIAKMDKPTKQIMRKEWGEQLNDFDDAPIAYALQVSFDIFSNKMQPYMCLQKFAQICHNHAKNSTVLQDGNKHSKTSYQEQYDDMLKAAAEKGFKNLNSDEWDHFRKERIRLSSAISMQGLPPRAEIMKQYA